LRITRQSDKVSVATLIGERFLVTRLETNICSAYAASSVLSDPGSHSHAPKSLRRETGVVPLL